MVIFMKKSLKVFALAFLFLVLVILCLYSKEISLSIKKGITICSEVIIPSFLPCIIISNIIIRMNLISVFNQKISIYCLFLLSTISGYPVGAILLSELVLTKQISKTKAERILPCFINTGPAFVINVIGISQLNNINLGVIIYVCEVLSSFIIFVILKGNKIKLNISYSTIKIGEEIHKSIFQAFNSVKTISLYVIVFLAAEQVVSIVFGNRVAKIFITLCEVTGAVLNYKNIYLLTFLLSFCGLCVYMQIASIVKFKFNFLKVVLFRILHGVIAVIFLKTLLFVFKIKTAVFNNIGDSIELKLPNNYTYAIAVIFALICLLLSLNRKSSGNLPKDLI